MSVPNRARSSHVERTPSNIWALPALSVVMAVWLMPSGSKSRCRAKVVTSSCVAACSTRCRVWIAELL